jgi:transcriptional regulator with XRE-family HTH domain
MKDRCPRCDAAEFGPALHAYVREVDGRIFKAELEARRCGKCGEELVLRAALLAADRALTAALASGPVGAEGFQWLRRAAGLPAQDLAALLDLTPGTVSRWENSKNPLERRAVAIVAALALEALGEPANLRELLDNLVSGRKLAKRVRLEVQPDGGKPTQARRPRAASRPSVRAKAESSGA